MQLLNANYSYSFKYFLCNYSFSESFSQATEHDHVPKGILFEKSCTFIQEKE